MNICYDCANVQYDIVYASYGGMTAKVKGAKFPIVHDMDMGRKTKPYLRRICDKFFFGDRFE